MIINMADTKEKILVVESDPIISDLISRQALQSLGYQVQVVSDSNAAIAEAVRFEPDAIIINLNLPGLSGKDFMVALNSQGNTAPIIALALKGMEGAVIQAFRLGAADYLLWPLREAAVVAAVERVLRQVRDRRERERLTQQLQQGNVELQNRVRELTSIFAAGKTLTTLSEPKVTYDRIVENGLKITQAEIGWLLLRDDNQKAFVLAAFRNLPPSLASRINQPWDDGISSLVAMSGETLSIYGEPFKRFKLASLGQAAIIAPVKIQKQVIAILTVLRKTGKPFTQAEQNMLEAVSDFTAVALSNLRVFRSLDERARANQAALEYAAFREKILTDLLLVAAKELNSPLKNASTSLDLLFAEKIGRINSEQKQAVSGIQDYVQQIRRIAEAMASVPQPAAPARQASVCNLVEAAQVSVNRMQRYANSSSVVLTTEMSTMPVKAPLEANLALLIMDAIISNAIKNSSAGGTITIHIGKNEDGLSHAFVRDTGIGLDEHQKTRLFEPGYHIDPPAGQKFGGLGIHISLVKEIVVSAGGKIWADSKPGRGTTIQITFPDVLTG